MSRRQTVFFLPVDPRDESHRDPEYVDFSVPRLARYMHSAWKRHQDAVFWVDIDLAIKDSIKHDRMQLFFKERFQPIVFSRVERLKAGEMLYERLSSTTTKDLFETRSQLD